MEIINGIKWESASQPAEERELAFSATLECKASSKGKGSKFACLSAKGKYLKGVLDNEEILDEEAYYDLRFTQSSNAVIPADPAYDGIYNITLTGRAWIDTREPEDGDETDRKRDRVYLKGHDITFTKKANLIKREK